MDWITNDAISNYVVFFLGLIAGLILEVVRSRLQKQKPSIVEVQREKETSLISISPEARQRLQITYSQKKSMSIDELRQITLGLINKGDQPVQNIEVGVIFENASSDNLLEIIIDDPNWNSRDSKSELRYTPEGYLGVWISTSFMNPYKEYSDTLKVQIYSSEEVTINNIVGSGLGWSAKYFDKVSYNAQLASTVSKFDSFFSAGSILLKLFSR
jgi:hypothetical protein